MTSKTYRHLTQGQRYQIEALLKAGNNRTQVAGIVGVHKTTVGREIKRNSTHCAKGPDRYKAASAHNFALKRAYAPGRPKSDCPAIARRIAFLARCGWSPQQISGVCRNRAVPMLSTEAIYQWVYMQKQKGTGHKDLVLLLRRSHRRRRKRRLMRQPRVIIKGKVSITQRPEVVARQERAGDLEIDLVKCTNGYLLTITDRKTLMNFIEAIPDKRADTVAHALISRLTPLKERIFTITSDNGTEFARHRQVAESLGADYYFADPYSPQQRGCNENQNGLVRQYLKRSTDLNELPKGYVQSVEDRLNNRPRKKLSYLTPIKIFLQPPNVALVS